MENKGEIEFGQAQPPADWERWNLEDIIDKVTTPDGREFALLPDEKVILSPSKPEGDIMPQAFVVKDGTKIPFEEWAKGKSIAE